MKKSKKNKNKRGKNKTRKISYIAGSHPHEDMPHYHLMIRLPTGKVKEIPEKFLRSNKDRNIKSATVNDIINFVVDNGYEEDTFRIFWKNKKLNKNTKLRHVKVDGAKLPLYEPNFKDKLEARLNDDLTGIEESADVPIIESPQSI